MLQKLQRLKTIRKNESAVILIASLWMIAILAVFAVSIGRQSGVSLKLTSYDVDKLKAYFIARAGITRAVEEKALEFRDNISIGVDALSQAWASNKELFDNHVFGEGSYTIGYEYPSAEDDEKEPVMLYGLMDEESKININRAAEDTLFNLLVYFDIDEDKAREIAGAVIDWRDKDDNAASSQLRLLYGAENSYYQGLASPYACKNSDFDSIYELCLVKGVTSEVMEKISPYITVFGDGKVNINTAPEPVLSALIGPGFSSLCSKIVDYREGDDDTIGTRDDAWFSYGSTVVQRKEEGLVEIKNLQDAQWYANIYGITTDEYNRLRDLVSGSEAQAAVSSRTYRAIALAEVRRVKAFVEVVYYFESKDKPPLIKYWYQE